MHCDKPVLDFIFCDEEERTKIREIEDCIRAQCTRAGIPVKSAYDIRRAVASEMDRRGVPIEDVGWYLRHCDILRKLVKRETGFEQIPAHKNTDK